ncbi:hypothetical protein HUG17_0865 [Dermatophagoides farinae]|uniref:Uncharacterized protein n=1 Tax=Dermatophagoides farinae TaxID=6954 RepID=A0A9D4P7M7_DERFA|nr:uncharacterized protein LOC124499662 [Dermatophagoides farinae]KAH7645327.1 hypothetical protein HUG17_0865 [Dermatophagoides farinae]
MLPKIKTFLYDAIKHIVEENGTIRYRLLHSVDFSLYIYWLIRALFISLIFIDPEKFPLYRYDYASLYFWNHRNILNKFFMIIGILLVLIGLLGIRTFFFNHVDTLSFQIFYDCIVYNMDQYYKSRDTDENIAMKLSQRFEDYQQQFALNHRLLSIIIPRLFNHWFRIRVWIDSWLQLDRVDRNLFENRNKMRLFPNANRKSRTHVLLFVLIIDFCNHILHIFILLPSSARQVLITSTFVKMKNHFASVSLIPKLSANWNLWYRSVELRSLLQVTKILEVHCTGTLADNPDELADSWSHKRQHGPNIIEEDGNL